MMITGREPAVGEEAENTLAHTLELRFLKMFEFKDEEGVFYDVLNVEGNFRKVLEMLFSKTFVLYRLGGLQES